MDPESLAAATASTTNATRKVRFAPKGPPRRSQQKLVLPKPEKVEEEADAIKAEELMRRFHESSAMRAKAKLENKGPVYVAASSPSLRSFTVKKAQSSSDDGPVAPQKDYKEPWDYHHTYYPTTLPLRLPHTGNPEVLDEQEFGGASESVAFEESSTNPAEDLDLYEEAEDNKIFFFQLPAPMPMLKKQANAESSETASNSNASRARACRFDDLPSGYLGKMLVYRSGAVKLKLGETLYDVSPGLKCEFSQDVVAINTEEKSCYNIGEISKRANITPDIDSIFASMPDS